ncbi:hypothetical protein HY501_02790 [Candidatus Woesearchaeota archaeon]|nr:hypothetical protein [Candidatus Woesearchaeota archaeon]
MKICSVCLKNDILCTGCSKRLESGKISRADIDVSRAIFGAGLDADFMRAFHASGCLAIVADSVNTGLLIGKSGRNVNKLTKAMGMEVRIIEHMNDEKKLIEKAISAPILGINKSYGKYEIYKIKLEKRFRKRENLMPLVSQLLNKNVKFVFE